MVNWLTYPGTTIVLPFVPTISKPCVTSALVTRNVTGLFAGTCTSAGWKANIIAINTTVAPCSSLVTPRLVKRGSFQTFVGSIVSTWLGGWKALPASPTVSVVRNATIRNPEAHIQIFS